MATVCKTASTQCNLVMLNKPTVANKRSQTFPNRSSKGSQCCMGIKVHKGCQTDAVQETSTVFFLTASHTAHQAPTEEAWSQTNVSDIFPLKVVTDILSLPQYLALSYRRMIITNDHLVLQNTPDPMTVTVDSSGLCQVAILFKATEEHNLVIENMFDVNAFTYFLSSLITASFCMGIDEEHVTSNCSKLVQNTYPFLRYSSRDCPMLMPSTSFRRKIDRCLYCRLLTKQMKCSRKRKILPIEMGKNSQKDNSKIKISLLSPENRKKRLANMRRQKFLLKKKVKSLENLIKSVTSKCSCACTCGGCTCGGCIVSKPGCM